MQLQDYVSPAAVVPIGGFTVGEGEHRRAPIFQEVVSEARQAETTSILRMKIIMDEDDIAFLLQFPRVKQQEALLWRYGEGLRRHATAVHAGKTPDTHTDITLAHAAGSDVPLVFEGVRTHMDNLYDKLTRPRSKGGTYEIDLSRWRAIPSESGELQWHTPNYSAMVYQTANGLMSDWRKAMYTGLLGRHDDSVFVREEGGKGAPPKFVTPSWDGDLLNMRKGKMAAAYRAKSLSKHLDPSMLRGADPDAAAQVVYKYKQGGAAKEFVEPFLPVMLPGKIFSVKSLSGWEAVRKQIEEFVFKHEDRYSVLQQPLIRRDALQKHLPQKLRADLLGLIQSHQDRLPGSGHKDAATTFTPAALLSARLANQDVEPANKAIALFSPQYGSKREMPVTDAELEHIGVSRKDYDDIVNKYFCEADPQKPFAVLGPDGKERPSPLKVAIDQAIGSMSRKYRGNPTHVDALQRLDFEILRDIQKFIHKTNGLPDYMEFARAVMKRRKGEADAPSDEAMKKLWDNATVAGEKRARSYVSDVAHINLGGGSRRSIAAGGGEAALGHAGEERSREDSGRATSVDAGGYTSSHIGTLDVKAVKGFNTGQKRSAVTDSGATGDLNIYWGRGVRSLWDTAQELDKLKQEKDQADEDWEVDEKRAAARLADQSELYSQLEKIFVLDYVRKHGGDNPDAISLTAALQYARRTAVAMMRSKGYHMDDRPATELGPAEEKQMRALIRKDISAGSTQAAEKPAPAPGVIPMPTGGQSPPPGMPTPDQFKGMDKDRLADYFGSAMFINALAQDPHKLEYARILMGQLKMKSLAAAIARAEEKARATA